MLISKFAMLDYRVTNHIYLSTTQKTSKANLVGQSDFPLTLLYFRAWCYLCPELQIDNPDLSLCTSKHINQHSVMRIFLQHHILFTNYLFRYILDLCLKIYIEF